MSESPHSDHEKPPEAKLARWVESDRWMMRALRCVAEEELPDAWIVAGFVRAKVWDVLHGFEPRTPTADIDVVFFDPGRPAAEDREIEKRLAAREPAYPWEVYNQAHMHAFNGDAPYRGTVDAFSRWAETVSTVGIRLDSGGKLAVAAPHGLNDLFQMVIRPTPHPDSRRDIFEQRLRTKGWTEQWPKARVCA